MGGKCIYAAQRRRRRTYMSLDESAVTCLVALEHYVLSTLSLVINNRGMYDRLPDALPDDGLNLTSMIFSRESVHIPPVPAFCSSMYVCMYVCSLLLCFSVFCFCFLLFFPSFYFFSFFFSLSLPFFFLSLTFYWRADPLGSTFFLECTYFG